MADLLRLARGSLFEIAGVLIYESMLYKIEAENQTSEIPRHAMVYLITCLTDSKKGDVHVSPREKRKKKGFALLQMDDTGDFRSQKAPAALVHVKFLRR